ncbi:ATP-binding protein [Streptomyces sp. NPDC048281]|uniref:ATP-binding protein n=1 Tax=Streptomyces sp. NPDC048281 TaxID=3154715 RepID=UPI0034343335
MHSPTRQGPPTLGSLGTIRFTQAYRKEPDSVPLVRHRFMEAAHEGKLDEDLAQRAELCLSELTGNAVNHAQDPRERCQILVEVTVRAIHRRLHLEIGVWDIDQAHVPDLPDQAQAIRDLFDLPEDSTSGRGLLLVASTAEEFGIVLGPHGKRIWCRWPL